MSKTVSIKLGGKTWAMPANYRASKQLADLGIDPLKIAMDASVNKGMVELGQERVITIVHVGITEAGGELDRDEVGELLMDYGIVRAYEMAGRYLTAMVVGGPERPEAGKKKGQASARQAG